MSGGFIYVLLASCLAVVQSGCTVGTPQAGTALRAPKQSISVGAGCVCVVAPASNVDFLAVGTASQGRGNLVLVNMKGEASPQRRAHFGGAARAVCSMDGKLIAAGSGTGIVNLYDVATWEQTGVVGREDGAYVRSLAFSPDDKTLAVADNLGVVRLWEVAASTNRVVFDRDKSTLVPARRGVRVGQVAFSPDGTILAIAVPEGVILCDAAMGREVDLIRLKKFERRQIAFSVDGNLLAVSDGPLVSLWDASTRRLIRKLEVDYEGRPSRLIFSPDGRWVVGTIIRHNRYPGRLVVWDAASGEQIAGFFCHRLPANDVTFLPDGKLIATCGDDHTVKLWDLAAIIAEARISE